MQCLIKVDIQTGRVLEDNLRELWDSQGLVLELNDPVGRRKPLSYNQSLHEAPAPYLDSESEQTLLDRVQKFNVRWRRRKYKHAWSDGDIYQLAVCMGLQNQKYKCAAARLARSPRACKIMFAKLKKAGVV